jgi:hypothetical protein
MAGAEKMMILTTGLFNGFDFFLLLLNLFCLTFLNELSKWQWLNSKFTVIGLHIHVPEVPELVHGLLIHVQLYMYALLCKVLRHVVL